MTDEAPVFRPGDRVRWLHTYMMGTIVDRPVGPRMDPRKERDTCWVQWDDKMEPSLQSREYLHLELRLNTRLVGIEI